MSKEHSTISEEELAPQEGAAPAAPSPAAGLRSSIIEFIVIIVTALALAWAITTFVVKPYQIPSGSMLETIQLDDHVLSEKISYYTRSPQQGEIVTFKDPLDPDTTLIKRVIAVGGQTVDLIDGVVYVDGQPLDEDAYTGGKPSYPLDGPAQIQYPYTVPEGYIWCMGDNRTNSSDSRYFGAVPVESVTGHAFFTYWPISSFGFLE
ncbi:MAG: signal peptidase I [Coriobacteriales bacterium]